MKTFYAATLGTVYFRFDDKVARDNFVAAQPDIRVAVPSSDRGLRNASQQAGASWKQAFADNRIEILTRIP